MLRLIAVLLLSTLIFNQSLAQDKSNGIRYADKAWGQRPSYGFFVAPSFNSHAANFTGAEWRGIPNCCPRFETGTGLGFNFGLFYAFPLFVDWDLNLRFGYYNLNALLSKEEPVILAGPDGTAIEGLFEHSIDASIASAAFAPSLSYRATERLKVNLGLRLGFLLQKSFSQKEEIKEPGFGVFYDTKKRTRHEFSGDIPNASAIELAGLAGISYSLPLSDSYEWFLEPEAFYSLGITPIASNLSWNASYLSAGVAIKYSPREKIIPVAPPKEAPLPPLPPPPPPPKFKAFIAAVSVDENGKESPISTIRVDEYLKRKIHPLLNYVFFDKNSAEIPKRYKRMTAEEKANFSPNFLANLKTMDVYYQILNIVGDRMKRFPNTSLHLIGCGDNKGPEANNVQLAKRRAENVKNFIVKEWGVDPARITTEGKVLPDIPSNPTRAEGDQENRRVEMISDYNEILFKPIVVRDTIRTTTPPILRFKPRVSAEAGVKEWKIATWQGDQTLKVFKGKGTPPKTIELNLKKEQKYVPLLNKPFKYQLTVIDNDNNKWESEIQSLKVKAYTIQNKFVALLNGEEVDARDYDQFSLISFDFNKTNLKPEHEPIINMARKRIKPNSKVIIEGHTDNTGNPQINKQLSLQRAYATADALKVDRKYAKGYGASNPLYPNSTPEGRFYNRTVVITIETKITLE